ncbi:hypothetical protein FOA52_004774 [Chlamydomonas sp. UWO 241]|nr:hypothetical protein FOA52_004774 [Chlamydomonas sp. UWO 241]
MGSVDELREALRDNLDRSGRLNTLKAKLRASIYSAISGSDLTDAPEPSSENLVINELIREYLTFNNYRETLSVFVPETGQPAMKPFDRSFLTQHLNMPLDGPNSKQLPLLYSMVASRQTPHPATTELAVADDE